MSRATDAWTAVRGRPDRFLLSAWPWRSLAYVLTSVPMGVATAVVLATALLVGALTLVVVVGLAVLAGIPLLTGLLGVVERRRLALVRPGPAGGTSLVERLRAGRRVPVSWPEVGYAVLLGTLLWLVDAGAAILLVTVPVVLLLAPWLRTVEEMNVLGWHVDTALDGVLACAAGVLALVASAYLVTLLAAAQGALARMLLDPQEARLTAAQRRVAGGIMGMAQDRAFAPERTHAGAHVVIGLDDDNGALLGGGHRQQLGSLRRLVNRAAGACQSARP